MPTIARIGPYRFYFYSNEGNEPPHVHVQRERRLAKFWLEEVAIVSSNGFAAHELRNIEAIINQNQQRFLEAWHEFFSRRR